MRSEQTLTFRAARLPDPPPFLCAIFVQLTEHLEEARTGEAIVLGCVGYHIQGTLHDQAWNSCSDYKLS